MNLLKIKTPTVSGISAAMAIHDEFIYFIEIDEESKPQRKITVPLADGCINNGQIKNFDMLEVAFLEGQAIVEASDLQPPPANKFRGVAPLTYFESLDSPFRVFDDAPVLLSAF